MKAQAERAIADCRRIALMTEEPGRTTRRFLTEPTHAVHDLLRKRMQALGMKVKVDAVGNLRGLWRPRGAAAKRLLLGSHIDTVPDAGAFDGVLGVMLALEWVAIARELRLPLAIEVIAFSEEEGMRYGVPFLGSRAVTGTFDAAILKGRDADGVTMDAAMRAFGLNPSKIKAAAIGNDVIGFVELHIEQGPVLEAEEIPVAVVEGITGQTRVNLCFTGQANHAGTTPMHLRRDALAAAAEWITKVEKQIGKAAATTDPGIVATVGRIVAEPNAGNVIEHPKTEIFAEDSSPRTLPFKRTVPQSRLLALERLPHTSTKRKQALNHQTIMHQTIAHISLCSGHIHQFGTNAQ